jgi:hypothetical protein
MIRPLTLVTMVAAMAAGMHVYQTKHEVALLDRELRQIVRAIEEQNERTLALSAEWAWLNEPERLRLAAQRHLALEPMTPTQFVRFAEFERRLPGVAAFDGPPALFAARDTGAGAPQPDGAIRLELAARPEPVPPLRVTVAAATAPRPAEARPPEPAPAAARPAEPAPSGANAAERTAAEPAAAAASAPAPAVAVPGVTLAAIAASAVPAAMAAPATPAPTPAPVAAAPRPAPPRPPVTLATARPSVPRQAPEVAALPAIAGPSRGAEPSRQVAVARATAAPASLPPPATAGSMLGSARSALAPPVPYGSLPPPVPFTAANAAPFAGTAVR